MNVTSFSRLHPSLALTVGVGVAAITALVLGGPLNPPAGPVTSTYKTLTEVEPRIAINAANTPGDADSLFKITQPGSYYLTGNITGVVGKHGIEIASSGVTLDLMGFDLSGVSGMGAFDGVSVTVNNLTNITVRNGSIRRWGDEGVDLDTFLAINSAVIDVHASGNTGNGIIIGDGCTITGCTAYDNTGSGISTGIGCTITGCTANQNTANGISASIGCTITGCSAYVNAGNGISAGQSCTITGCTANQNTGSGIVTFASCTITGCTASFNTGSGILSSSGCTVADCTATSNIVQGIRIFSGSTVADCTASFNQIDGILVTDNCHVRGNTCASNGLSTASIGAGIHATGERNRIDGNSCTGSDRGIIIDDIANIIIRNTCGGNSNNWNVVAGNVILVVNATFAGAVNGSSGGVAPGSTDPNANFSY